MKRNRTLVAVSLLLTMGVVIGLTLSNPDRIVPAAQGEMIKEFKQEHGMK